MVLVIDVDLNTFKFMKREDASFLWTETTTAFVLIKPFPDLIARTAIMKSTPEADEAFKVKELYTPLSKYCLNFVIDGIEIAAIQQEPPAVTEGNIFEEKEKEVTEVE